MLYWGFYFRATTLALVLLAAITIEGAEFKRFDGIHRVAKDAQVTAPAVLGRRDNVCMEGLKQCPPNLNGGCCPTNYNCATDSCYATTAGPSTCGGRVSWYACAAEYGGGCCPQGYLCETADGCVPPSGSPYTYGCPASQTLCPLSLSYGCCPNGMACAINQCYSTEAIIITTTMTIATTKNGDETTYKTTVTSKGSPTIPTALPTAQSGNNGDQAILKFFPGTVAKVSPISDSGKDNDDNGLSKATLAGIIAGSVAFLIIVLVAAFIIIRHLNKVVAAVGGSRQSESSKARPPMKQFKPTDSEVDTFSVDPLMTTPRPVVPRHDPAALSQHDTSTADYNNSRGPTPSVSAAGGYQPNNESAGNSRHTSFDVNNNVDYFEQGRNSHQSAKHSTMNRVSSDSKGTYVHLRHWSNASDGSEGQPPPEATWTNVPPPPGELEAASYIPELATSDPPTGRLSHDERRASGQGSSVMTKPPLVHQRKRSDQRARSDSLGVLSEETHGFHGFFGPPNYLVGQTESHRPETRGAGAPTTKEPQNQGEQGPSEQ